MFSPDLQTLLLNHQWILVAALSGLFLLGFWVQGWRVHKLKKQVQRLQHDYVITHESLLNMGQQLLSLEKQWISSRDETAHFPSNFQKKPNLKVVNSDDLASPSSSLQSNRGLSSHGLSNHDNARHLLAKGVDIAQAAKMTGLSHSEVSLINALRKKQGAKA